MPAPPRARVGASSEPKVTDEPACPPAPPEHGVQIVAAGADHAGWAPREIAAAATSGWVAFTDVLNGGPESQRAQRVAAYRQGRRRLLKLLQHRDGGCLCVWCSKALKRGQLTIDHLVPRRLGGSHDAANLCLACKPCNHERNDTDPLSWYATCCSRGMQPRAHVLAEHLHAVGLIADTAELGVS